MTPPANRADAPSPSLAPNASDGSESVAPTDAGARGPPPAASHEPPQVLRRLQESIGQAVIGSESIVRLMTVALCSNGHVLIEGVPGLAKTYLVRSFATCLNLSFKRIQFTPDMLPSDIMGAIVINPKSQGFEFRPGPIFANVVLADEINRAPPKVQSALLEAMQERQVTMEGKAYPMPDPFMVIATQNPIEQEGTYPLPEAELDRFLFRILLTYPTSEEEFRILRSRSDAGDIYPDRGLVSSDLLKTFAERSQAIYVGDEVLQYLTGVVRETRAEPRLLIGASPRSGVQFLRSVKASVLFDGRPYVIPDDVKSLAFAVLNHRVVIHPEVMAQQITTSQARSEELLGEVISALVARVPPPR
ncbi:MAG: MoxR family ATPase [Thermoplasmata archaeon]